MEAFVSSQRNYENIKNHYCRVAPKTGPNSASCCFGINFPHRRLFQTVVDRSLPEQLGP
jgi:hypothetical protein